MHYVLFSFKNWHETLFNLQVWTVLQEDSRNVYVKILQEQLPKAREAVQFSWRYYLTYCKALETVVDSNFKMNELQIAH